MREEPEEVVVGAGGVGGSLRFSVFLTAEEAEAEAGMVVGMDREGRKSKLTRFADACSFVELDRVHQRHRSRRALHLETQIAVVYQYRKFVVRRLLGNGGGDEVGRSSREWRGHEILRT